MIRFPIEQGSLVALFVFQLAKLHYFPEKHNKMIIFLIALGVLSIQITPIIQVGLKKNRRLSSLRIIYMML